MAGRIVDTLVVQRKPGGGFQVSVPKGRVAGVLKLKGGELLQVTIDERNRSWTYHVID